MKVFAATSNAKENSRQTCDGGDSKVGCSEKQREGLAVRSNAKANSRQTCDGGDVKVSCRLKKLPYLLTLKRRSLRAFDVKSNAKANSRQTGDGGDVRVCCRGTRCHFS